MEGALIQREWVSTYEAGLEAMLRGGHDAYLVDYRLGARDGLELLRQAMAGGCRAPVIIMTGQGDQVVDAQAMTEERNRRLWRAVLRVTYHLPLALFLSAFHIRAYGLLRAIKRP